MKTEWPIYIDADRMFEKETIHSVISLQNIHQTWAVTPAGKLHQIPGEEADIKKEAARAKWLADVRTIITEPMVKAWHAVEFGVSALAVEAIKENYNSKDANVQRVARGLDNILKADLAKKFSAAQNKASAGKKWDAFREFEQIAKSYANYPEAKRAQTEADKLKGDAAVKKEMEAYMLLEKVLKHFDSRTPAELKAAKDADAELKQKFAETECAKAAKHIKVKE